MKLDETVFVNGVQRSGLPSRSILRTKTCVRVHGSFYPHIFTVIARDSKKWKREYKRKTYAERVNSRLDVSYGFEHNGIRALKKMTLRTALALLIMITMALAHVKRLPPKHVHYNSVVKCPLSLVIKKIK